MPVTRDYEAAYDEAVSGIEQTRTPVHFAGAVPQDIAPGATATFILSPNMELQPTILKLPDDYANALELVEASVGSTNLNAGDGPIPGSVFKSESNFRFLSIVPIKPSQPLRVRLRNKSSTALTGVNFMVAGRVSRA